jgi:hypothetical protein
VAARESPEWLRRRVALQCQGCHLECILHERVDLRLSLTRAKQVDVVFAGRACL